ncbi:MAG: 3-dehydroquinate dehydratase [Bacteroidia bacterium]|nr:3-dehydroquinate dehydratase [Bacteroidia bacterium]
MKASKPKIGIINGPNLNLLGKRERKIYGEIPFPDYLARLKKKYKNVHFEYLQSNVEGILIDALHDMSGKCKGIVINPGGYSHTSVAIADAIRAVKVPVVEVHISKIFSREEYRQVLITASAAGGFIAGFGLKSYELAIHYLLGEIGEL